MNSTIAGCLDALLEGLSVRPVALRRAIGGPALESPSVLRGKGSWGSFKQEASPGFLFEWANLVQGTCTQHSETYRNHRICVGV